MKHSCICTWVASCWHMLLSPQHYCRCHLWVTRYVIATTRGAIAVALAVILIVKANKNGVSYGNTIELNYLLTGLNSLLKNVVNNVCLRPFHVRTCECICLWPYFQSVRLSILLHRNLGSVWLTSWILLRWTNTLIPNRERGAIFNLVGSFGINIRWDPTCIPLSLEGLSKATTHTPHRICSMWMTCVNSMPEYGHTKELAEFAGVWNRGACDFSELFVNESVHMWLKWRWRRSSIKSKQLRVLKDLLCWNLKSIDVYGTLQLWCVCMIDFSPILVIELTTKGSYHLYSLWHLCLCTSMTIET